MSARRLAPVAFGAILVALFALSLELPTSPAEAAAALAAVETCHTGDAIAAYQLGELEHARLPLHTWVLSSFAHGQPHRVSVTTARWMSFFAITCAALAGALAFGTNWSLAAVLILSTPAIWAVATRGTPGALLAMLLTLAWAAYEAGRRTRAPTMRWSLPPILGAAASLVWSPAILFVALALLVEVARARRHEVDWFRLSAGCLGSIALIGLWQMAYAGFAPDASTWWSRMFADLANGNPVLAARAASSRWIPALGVLMPALVLAVLGRTRFAPTGGNPKTEIRVGTGTAVAAAVLVVTAVVSPGVPPAATIPAGIAAIGFSTRRRWTGDSAERSWRAGSVVVVALLALVAIGLLRTPRGEAYLDTSSVDAIGRDVAVVVDRELDAPETWRLVSRLGRPASRAPRSGEPAVYIGRSPVGPGFSKRGPLSPEGWSLLGRPLERPELPEDTRIAFEQALQDARARYDKDSTDALSAIWVGRRLAYLGRYREALEWYDEAGLRHPTDSRIWRHRGHRFISLRQFPRAIQELERAATLERGKPDRIEPDGLPNAAGIPRSTTQTNIWYHLGLAYYLSGDLEQTVRCFRECVELSENDDMWVAAAHWLHIGLRRLGRDASAAELLLGLHDEMEILENESYHDLLSMYAGRLAAEEVQARLDRGDGLAYGLARWYDDQGERERARAAYRAIVAEAPWAAFGTIAAEAELTARSRRDIPVW